MSTVYQMAPSPSIEEDGEPVVEVTVGSWDAARRMVARFVPPGQATWEGTAAAWFEAGNRHVLPFYVVIIGRDHLVLYCRSVGGQLGLPIAIVRVRRAVQAVAA